MGVPLRATDVTVPLVSAKSEVVSGLLSASLKVTVNVSGALLTVAEMLSVTVTVGAKVSMPWVISTSPACDSTLPATSVKVEVVAMLRLMSPEAMPGVGVPTRV